MKDESGKMKKKFTSADIQVIPEAMGVRHRPELYLGMVDSQGLYNLVGELVKANIASNYSSQWSSLEISLQNDGSIQLKDDGCGQPVWRERVEDKQSILEKNMVGLVAGMWDATIYKTVGYLLNLGIVVNAFSEWCILETGVEGVLYRLECAQGVLKQPLIVVGPAEQNGTTLHFKPDPEIWGEVQVVAAELEAVLQPLVLPPYHLTRPDNCHLFITKS